MLTASSSRVDRKVKARDSSVSTCCGSSPVDQQQRLSNMRNLVKNFPGAALKSPPSSSLSPNNEELSEASAVAAEKRRKAAAAAARKRRRKIYSARRRTNKTLRSTSQQQQQQLPHSSSGPSSFIDTNAIITSSSYQGTDGGGTSCIAPTNHVSYREQEHAVSLKAVQTTIRRLESTMEGMADVTLRWQNGEMIAIPTECTYEACILLQTCRRTTTTSSTKAIIKLATAESEIDASPPQDWAYRIKRVRQVAMMNATDHHHDGISAAGAAPYCWIPRSGDCSFLRECFPVRSYGLRQNNSRVHVVAHRFNETHEVIQRMARYLWPGPVTFHVAVPDLDGGGRGKLAVSISQQRSFWSNLTVCYHCEGTNNVKTPLIATKSTCPFITLRCPQHPLAIKVAQGHMGESKQEKNGTIKEGGSMDCSEASLSVLVGFPIVKATTGVGSDHPRRYCRSSEDVQNNETILAGRFANDPLVHRRVTAATAMSAVLDGEHQTELFAVPTCEYGEPSRHEVWIHGPSRTVTLWDNNEKQQPHGRATTAAISICGSSSSSWNRSPQQVVAISRGLPPTNLIGSTMMTTAAAATMSRERLQTALRQHVPRRPALSKEKDQIIQAILYRWTIVEETAS